LIGWLAGGKMNKKFNLVITSIILISFLGLNFSCVTYTSKKIRVNRGEKWKDGNVKFTTVFTKSGELYEFPMSQPATIMGDKIVGEAVDDGGREYPVSIPLSQVEVVWIKKVDGKRTFIKSFSIAGVAAVASIIAIAASDPSCPFVYSFDGNKFVLDAEPYAGAVCSGLKRTESVSLDHLEEVNGEYRMIMANELEETEYADRLVLRVVDHPTGVRAVPDISGNIITVSRPLSPARAYDGKGNDLLPYISQNDHHVWTGADDVTIPGDNTELKEELIFEFPKPENTSRAKLLFNGGSTLLGSRTLKFFLGLYGQELSGWYNDVKLPGIAFLKLANLALREELYSLWVQVETEKGWESRMLFLGGPFFISKEKVYNLDLSGVTGDMLRIKLTPPAGFWKIDYIAVDYSENLPVQVTELKAVKGILNGNEDGETTAKLAAADDNFLVMPNNGDMVELIFQAPPHHPDTERTVLLEAVGYYDMHLKFGGEPRWDIIDKVYSEPGFLLRFALKEYDRWKREGL
jgi:hypothetical protein